MKPIIRFLIIAVAAGLLSLIAVSCTTPISKRGMKVANLKNEMLPDSPFQSVYKESILVAVGIDKYKHVDRLRHAVGDAHAIVELFKASGFKTAEIYDEDASKEKIMGALEGAIKNSGPDDRIVFFFAGHGIDLRDSEGGLKGFLIPVGGDTKDQASLIPMNWLQVDLIANANVSAKHILFLLDACSSGMVAARSSVTVDPTVRNYITELMKRKARQVITAGTGDQQVLDGGYKGHSIFAGLVLQGMEDNLADINNDYHITATELGLFLSQRVHIKSRGAQKPDFAKLVGTKGGEVILKFPDDKQRKLLEDRDKTPTALQAELILDVRDSKGAIVSYDVFVYDLEMKLVAKKKNVRLSTRIPDLPGGDYQVIIVPRSHRYEQVKLILGLYGPTVKKVRLPSAVHKIVPMPHL